MNIVFELTSKQVVKVLYNLNREHVYLNNFVEAICYLANIFLLENSRNQICIHVFNEHKACLVFPQTTKDFHRVRDRRLTEIGKTIKNRFFDFLENTEPINEENGCLSQALFKSFCCRVIRHESTGSRNSFGVFEVSCFFDFKNDGDQLPTTDKSSLRV